jgi:hypothetical protein
MDRIKPVLSRVDMKEIWYMKTTKAISTLWFIEFCLAACGRSAWSADWQWSIEVRGGIERAGSAQAFLWIPPDCQKVHGVVLAQHNMEEISIL